MLFFQGFKVLGRAMRIPPPAVSLFPGLALVHFVARELSLTILCIRKVFNCVIDVLVRQGVIAIITNSFYSEHGIYQGTW